MAATFAGLCCALFAGLTGNIWFIWVGLLLVLYDLFFN